MADTPAYDALIFDLGGVIVPHDNAVLAARLVSRCSAPDAAQRLNGLAHAATYGNGERTIGQLHGASWRAWAMTATGRSSWKTGAVTCRWILR